MQLLMFFSFFFTDPPSRLYQYKATANEVKRLQTIHNRLNRSSYTQSELYLYNSQWISRPFYVPLSDIQWFLTVFWYIRLVKLPFWEWESITVGLHETCAGTRILIYLCVCYEELLGFYAERSYLRIPNKAYTWSGWHRALKSLCHPAVLNDTRSSITNFCPFKFGKYVNLVSPWKNLNVFFKCLITHF